MQVILMNSARIIYHHQCLSVTFLLYKHSVFNYQPDNSWRLNALTSRIWYLILKFCIKQSSIIVMWVDHDHETENFVAVTEEKEVQKLVIKDRFFYSLCHSVCSLCILCWRVYINNDVFFSISALWSFSL